MIPGHLFRNRTTVAAYGMTVLFATLHTWGGFAWPVYFQAELRLSPLKAGINYLVFQAFLVVAAGISGTLLSKLGYYQPLQLFGFALLSLGTGLGILLKPDTTTVVWVVFLAITATGLSFVMTTILPAILAPLAESDVATATGVFSFLRSFGFMWGATFSVVVFNSAFDQFAPNIRDKTVQATLARGQAFETISSPYIDNLPKEVRAEVIGVFDDALNVVWEVALALAVCGMLLVFVEKHVPLRTQLDTKYGLENKRQDVGDKERGEGTALDGMNRDHGEQTATHDRTYSRPSSEHRYQGAMSLSSERRSLYSTKNMSTGNNASTRELIER
jgi:hypothetical protein